MASVSFKVDFSVAVAQRLPAQTGAGSDGIAGKRTFEPVTTLPPIRVIRRPCAALPGTAKKGAGGWARLSC